jgi:hypothetical protein
MDFDGFTVVSYSFGFEPWNIIYRNFAQILFSHILCISV